MAEGISLLTSLAQPCPAHGYALQSTRDGSGYLCIQDYSGKCTFKSHTFTSFDRHGKCKWHSVSKGRRITFWSFESDKKQEKAQA